MSARSRLAQLLKAALPVLFVASCASGDRLPSAVEGSAPTTTEPPPAQTFTCPADQVEADGLTPKSYQPDGPLPDPSELPAGSTMAEIRDLGSLLQRAGFAGCAGCGLGLGAKRAMASIRSVTPKSLSAEPKYTGVRSPLR